MFDKLKLFWQALQIGKSVANPEMWKSHQITANKIILLLTTLLGIAHAYGINLNMDSETVMAIGGGIYGLANWLVTLATSKKVGLPVNTLSGAQSASGSVQQGDGPVQGSQTQQTLPSLSEPLIREGERALAADRGRQLVDKEMSDMSP